MRACVRACVRVCVCARVRARVRAVRGVVSSGDPDLGGSTRLCYVDLCRCVCSMFKRVSEGRRVSPCPTQTTDSRRSHTAVFRSLA